MYSIDRILAMKKGAYSLFDGTIAPGSTKAPDAKTVVFTLSKPSAIFLATVPEIHVLNEELVRANEADGDLGTAWLSKNAAGSGSFVLKRYDPAIGWQATRHEDHFFGWNMVENPLDTIEFRTVTEINSRVLGLMNGDFHGTDGYLPQDQVKRLAASQNVVVDKPVPVQFRNYVLGVAQGDFGVSLYTHRPIVDDLVGRLPATLELAFVSVILSAILGIPLGVLAAIKRNSWLDHLLRVFTVSGLAIAAFWLAILLVDITHGVIDSRETN